MQSAIALNKPEPTFEAGKGMPEPSKLARQFVQDVLCRNPSERLSANQCLMLEAMKSSQNLKARSSEPSMNLAIQIVKEAGECRASFDPEVTGLVDELVEQPKSPPKVQENASLAESDALPTILQSRQQAKRVETHEFSI